MIHTSARSPEDPEKRTLKPAAFFEEMSRIVKELAVPDIRFSVLAPRDAALLLRPDLLSPDEKLRWGEMRLPNRTTMLIHPELLLETLGVSTVDIGNLPAGWVLVPHALPARFDAVLSWPLQPLTDAQHDALKRMPSRIAVQPPTRTMSSDDRDSEA